MTKYNLEGKPMFPLYCPHYIMSLLFYSLQKIFKENWEEYSVI